MGAGRAARRPAGGAWGAPQLLHRLDNLRALWPQLALSDEGTGVCAWVYRMDSQAMVTDPPTWRVFSALFR